MPLENDIKDALKLGYYNIMMHLDDSRYPLFPEDEKKFEDAVKYLERMGIVDEKNGKYVLTVYGKKVLDGMIKELMKRGKK